MCEDPTAPEGDDTDDGDDDGASFIEMIQEQYEEEQRVLCKGVVVGMLQVADALDRFGAQTEGEVREAVGAIRRLTERSIHRAGGVQIPALGLRYNSQHHAANGTLPVDSEEHDGIILDVLEPGYVLGGDILIRPALVTVGLFEKSAGADPPDEPDDPEDADRLDEPDDPECAEKTDPQA